MTDPTGDMHAADGPFTVTPPAGPFHLDLTPEAMRRILDDTASDSGELVFTGRVPHLSPAGWAYDPTCGCYLCTSSPRRRADESELR